MNGKPLMGRGMRQAVKKQHIDGDHLRGLDALKRGIEKVIEAHITASGGQ